ncbi:MAG: dethiobiotin synthase [Pirellulaceae bacterium]
MLTVSTLQSRRQQGCVVVGTDTEVGKTYWAAKLARFMVENRGQNAPTAQGPHLGVYKPVASGVDPGEVEASDAWILRHAAQLDCALDRVCPQRFTAPLAPPVAARAEGREVDEALLLDGLHWWLRRCEFLIVEGVGGLLSPLSDSMTIVDLLQRADLALPAIIVAANRLGVVNHTLLTTEALTARGMPVAGVLLNTLPQSTCDTSPPTNLELLRKYLSEIAVETDATRLWEQVIPSSWWSNEADPQGLDRSVE